MLSAITSDGEEAVRQFSRELDEWDPCSFIVGPEQIERATEELSEQARRDIDSAASNIERFAAAQLRSMSNLDVELSEGVTAGHRHIPVSAAGCYVPGGRYAHVASASMSICTAKAAGVPFAVAAAPPRDENGIHPATLYAMQRAGADAILCLGGVQAVASLAYGLFTGTPVDILVGPGNRFVAEAKRLLFGQVGIDCVAGPTEILVVADETADARIVALDLVSQAEHGPDSPCVLITTSRALGEAVEPFIQNEAASLPSGETALAAWRDHGEIVLAEDREEAAALSDQYASEHVEVHAEDLDWWLGRLRSYGALFLGDETTVAYGDKATGPNHILPTVGCAKYTGGLWVGTFMKTLTYQRMTPDASRQLGELTARISRVEGMEAHARAADVRVERYG